MKYESMMLASLFVACFALCTLVMGAMLTATPNTVRLANSPTPAAQLALPVNCVPATDAPACPHA